MPQARRLIPLILITLAGLLAAFAVVVAPRMGASGATSASASPAAPGAPVQTLDVVVLGDSYSAGNGADGAKYGPEGCERNTQNWGAKYATGMRQRGYAINLKVRACSGGVTRDFLTARDMKDVQNRTMPTPTGVSTPAQGNAYLAKKDPCNTGQFADEEFWRYQTTSVNGGTLSYSCSRFVRPQTHAITPATDLVLFTMGGNDAGFTTIVANCFVAKLAGPCETGIAAARESLPGSTQRTKAAVTDMIRVRGLRAGAKIVQLGYPWLQLDNNYTLPGPPPYAAGNAVRSLVTDGNAAIARGIADLNRTHPGRLSFVTGVPQKFSGHEPDATTPVGNLSTWIHQFGQGGALVNFYHPNPLGHTAYAELLLARGNFGVTVPSPATQIRMRVRVPDKRVEQGKPVRLVVRVRRSDGTTPRGRVVVRQRGADRVIAKKRVFVGANGRVEVRVRGLDPGRRTLKITYDDRRAQPVKRIRTVRILR